MEKDWARGEKKKAPRWSDLYEQKRKRQMAYALQQKQKSTKMERSSPEWERQEWLVLQTDWNQPLPKHLGTSDWTRRYGQPVNTPDEMPGNQEPSKARKTTQSNEKAKPDETLVADRRNGQNSAQQKAAKVPDGFETMYVIHPGKTNGNIVVIDEQNNSVLFNKELNPFAINGYTDGFHGYILRQGRIIGPFRPGQRMPPPMPGDKILRRQPPGQQKAQNQKQAQPNEKNPYEKMPYGDKLTNALNRVPEMLKGDAKALFQQITTDPKFAATLAAGAAAFAALQFTPIGPALNATFMVAFGFKSGFELAQFFYQAYQAKDEAGIKVAAESFKNAVEDGGPILIGGLANGLRNLTGLLTKLQGGKNASQTAAALSQLRPQQVAQFEEAIALRNAGKGADADAILGQLRSALGENNFREIESQILARTGGSLEFWNPNSTSIPRNGKRAVLGQKDAPLKPEVACGPTSCGMILNDLGKPVNMGALVQQANLTPAGAKIDRIASMLQASGVKDARWVNNISIDKLAKATSKGQPAIVHLNLERGGHYVIVDGVTVREGKKVIAIRDPNGPNGGRQYFAPVEEFAQKFSGNAVFTNTKTN